MATPHTTAQAALDRLAAAVVDRARVARTRVHPGLAWTEQARAHRCAVRASVAAVHAAVIDAHRHGVPAATIATTAGITLRYTNTIVEGAPAADSYSRLASSASARRRQVLNEAIDAVATYGTAHPVAHRAIADAHADGATAAALARVLDVPPALITRVVRAACPASATPL